MGGLAVAKIKQETFAERLQALREKAGVTQYRLAQLSGVSKQTLSRLELGTTQPSWDTVQALARGLGVEVGAFVIESARQTPPVPARPRGRPRKGK
jgi:transcriptional regulator with XRE-family HTH domain